MGLVGPEIAAVAAGLGTLRHGHGIRRESLQTVGIILGKAFRRGFSYNVVLENVPSAQRLGELMGIGAWDTLRVTGRKSGYGSDDQAPCPDRYSSKRHTGSSEL